MNHKTIVFLFFSLLLISVHAQELDNLKLLNKYYDNMDELDIKKIKKEIQDKGMLAYTAHYDIEDSCYVDIQETSSGNYNKYISSYNNPTIIRKSYYKTGELKSKSIRYWVISGVYGNYYSYDKSGNVISVTNPTANFTFTLEMLIEKIKREYEVDLWDLSTKTDVSFNYDEENPTYTVGFNLQRTPEGYCQGKSTYWRIVVDAKTGKTLKVSGTRRGELIDPPADQEEVTQATPKNRWSPLLDDDSPLI